MTKKLPSIINKIYSYRLVVLIIIFWQLISSFKIVPSYMLPAPTKVINAFINDFSLLMYHSRITLIEAFLGLSMGIILGFTIAYLMDRYKKMHEMFYPILVITQTIPTVAIAPLLVLWLGYGIAPKVALIIIVTFFPITIGLLDGFKSVDMDAINLMKSMNASKNQIFWHLKLPSSLTYFYAGLRISASYSIVGAVIAEWLGGFSGLGVYMIRVKQAYSFDKMFAVILLITIISLILIYLVGLLQKKTMPWLKKNNYE